MPTALYRIDGGEVLKISVAGQSFSESDPTYFGVLVDPTLTDGPDVTEVVDGVLGPMRVLGFAKIALPGSNTIRNATQGEIDAFAPAEAAWRDALDATQALTSINNHPRWRKVFKALLKRLISLFNTTNGKTNTMITQWEQYKADLAAAGSLAAIKTAVNGYSHINPNLPDSLTLQNAIDALQNDVSSSD